MATVNVNGVRLYYELSGDEELPLVLVHGGWLSHRSWELVAPPLSRSYRVLTYDRRGHSQSERPPGQGSIREDVADLAALIERLGLAPAWVGGVSSGGSIALRLAVERPELLRGLIVHEPAILSVLRDDPATAPLLKIARERFEAVVERIKRGEHEIAAEQFVDTVALGPGGWSRLPPDYRRIFIENAPTAADDQSDPEHLIFDLEWIKGFTKPVLLTKGGQSLSIFPPIVERLAAALPRAEVHEFEDAGHVPHRTHPRDFAETVSSFIGANSAREILGD